jgi:rRNA maturation protein Nop10
MQLCPVCEAPVVANVCDVCGHALAVASLPEVPLPRLLDLEVPLTAEGGPAAVLVLSELEPTRFAATASEEDWSEVEWERTCVGGVPDIAAGGLADLDTGREAPAAEHTPPSDGTVTCRYCRNVQASGLLCERCGLRLPWSRPAARATDPAQPQAVLACPQCGARTVQGRRCSNCGSAVSQGL